MKYGRTITRAALTVLFAAVMIATAAAGIKLYSDGNAANTSQDALEWADCAFRATLFIPILAGEACLYKGLLYFAAGREKRASRTAVNAALIAAAILLTALPALLLADRPVSIGGISARSSSALLWVQIALPFALIPVGAILTVVDIAACSAADKEQEERGEDAL
ncbi:MAG: hypothetical protein J5586_03270 [Clostridia bacterium]|nr:hypothetical protein [Clostridia bacterium]